MTASSKSSKIPKKGERSDVSVYFKPPLNQSPLRGPELKVSDTFGVASTLTNALSPIDLTAMAQGVSNVQRVGDSVTIHAIEFNYLLTAATGAPPARLSIFQWNEDTGSVVPTLGALYQNTGTQITVSPYPLNAVDQHDFGVIFDEVVSFQSSSASVSRSVKIPLNCRISFNGSATSGTGKLFLTTLSNVAASGPVISYNVRVYYSDV